MTGETELRSRPTARTLDAVAALTLLLVFLYGIPSRLIFAPLGAVGTPALVFSLGLFLWWVTYRILSPAPSFQPVKLPLVLLGASALVSYAVAALHPIEPLEVGAADRGLLSILAWAGIALVAADGVRSRQRLRQLLDRLVTAGTVLAGFGLLQFFVSLDVSRWYRIPGLSVNGALTLVQQRQGFSRVAGLADHPIEFSVALAMLFPLALHFAFHAEPSRRRWAWLRVLVIAVGIPVSISRSGVLALVVAMVILVPTWPVRRARRALLATPVFLMGLKVLVPGLLGTVAGLFLNFHRDTSISTRTEDYELVSQYFRGSPIVGHGWSTFKGATNLLLDNQWLYTLVQWGLLGVAALVSLFAIGMGTARGARRRAQDAEGRELGQVLAASIGAAMVSFVSFDALAYPIVTCTLFLLVGCAGAFWRLTRERQLEAVVRS